MVKKANPIFRARAVKRDTGEVVERGPVSRESALERGSLWYSSGDYRSVRVEQSDDSGKTWVRL